MYPNCFSNFFDCLGDCGGLAYLDNCNQCNGNNYDLCDNDYDGILNIDDICPNDPDNDIDGDEICGDIDIYPNCYSNMYDCLGDCGGKATIDECGTCNGTGNCSCPGFPDDVIQDCNGSCGGNSIVDDCGVCDGGDSDKDCTGICFGSAIIDDCGVCDGGESDKDCTGICFGSAIIDDCGVCDGGDSDKDCTGICFGSAIIDDCGVCDGGESDKDCTGICFGSAIIDDCGVCDGGDSDKDCNGDCFGIAFYDSCVICSGGNSDHNYNSDIDCNGECFGGGIDIDNDLICDNIDECIGEYDDCDICNGDGTWCLDAHIYFGEYNEGHLSVMYDSPLDIGGYQITIDGFNIINGFGGSSASSGFNIANNASTVMGFSLTGQSIPAGEGVLLVLNIEQISSNFCYSDIILSDIDGDEININIGSCIDVPCEDLDEDALCDFIDTCFGVLDECGVCNGINDSCLGCLDSLACNYDSEALINNNSCFYIQGSCDCSGDPIENYCDCNFLNSDCWGDCGGLAYLDYCGDCVSGNSPYEEGFLDLGCSCHNPAPLSYCEDSDGDGLGNIDSENYFCPEFNENNIYPTLTDNWILDCSDLCPEDIENDFDQDGICESNEILGCNDLMGCNFNPEATENDGSCIYLEFNNLMPEDDAVLFASELPYGFEEILFSWSIPSTECDNINYKLTVFDNLLNPIIIRFTYENTQYISISDLDIDDSIINSYNWNIISESNGLEYESELFSFSIDPTWMNIINDDIPNSFFLSDPFPNPFNPSTSISYGIPIYAQVSVNIFNSIGQEIYSLGERYYQPGIYSFIWDPINIASGIYYIQLVSDEIILNKKVISIK